MKTEYFSAEELMLRQGRGWKNLDRIAHAFVAHNATSVNRAINMSQAARIVDMDQAHLTRLISNRPGFVRLVSEKPSGRKIVTGVYYMPVYAAHSPDKMGYPKSLIDIAVLGYQDKGRTDHLVKSITLESEETSKAAQTIAKKNPLSQYLSQPPEGVLEVPYLTQDEDLDVVLIVDSMENFLETLGMYDGYKLSDLPESDIKAVKDNVGKMLTSLAGIYDTARALHNRKELR